MSGIACWAGSTELAIVADTQMNLIKYIQKKELERRFVKNHQQSLDFVSEIPGARELATALREPLED